ncbi:DUF4244 domain-containing protein [Paeniglutamicibacter antarcticus]|uniref:DUF4244 domain-containing protein n=1 Tax=Paeniglutamicibacter antarcticus TaxID=494023 RepID=A0ABP9TPE3_9MICC
MENDDTETAPGHIDLHEPAKPSEAMFSGEEGSTTAEFAIVTLAAVAFAGLLVSILSSGDVRGMLMGLIRQALSF